MKLQANRKTLYLIFGIDFALLLVLAGVLWLHRPVHHAGRINVFPFENDMMAGLMRGILHEPDISRESVCFLSFGENGTPPSSEFIARFADCRQPAVRGVDTSVAPPINRFFEKNTGRPGLVIQIISFREIISGVFDITVSISTLPRGHDRVVYRLSDVAGDWIIKNRTPS
jgi:hypothetical protein